MHFPNRSDYFRLMFRALRTMKCCKPLLAGLLPKGGLDRYVEKIWETLSAEQVRLTFSLVALFCSCFALFPLTFEAHI